MNNDEVLNREIYDGNVVVKFYAEWCGPCKMLTPIYDELKNEISDAKFFSVDVDSSGIPIRYGVKSVPTIVVFKDGEEVDRIVGLVHKEKIKKRILESFG